GLAEARAGRNRLFPFNPRAPAPKSGCMTRPRAPPLFQMDFNRMTAAVPVISMSLPADRFAKDFGASFERFGFAMITDHGIDPVLIDDAWARAKAFFALPEETKRAYHIPGGGGARGYTPFGTEIAKGAKE